ncbi:MAG: sodium-dependent transporter [Peptostreptococcaceae bacterium]|nr:sodium-dependent transporter [Peptostreptococcaceae bacterium]
MESKKRGEWGSKFGFIMAAVGSAVGLGNLWGFPYKMGKGGGFAFVLLYLVFAFTVGFIVMISEIAIGRYGKMDAVGSYKKIDKKTGFIGGLGVVAAFVIMSFYSVLGGWVLKYAFTYLLDIFGHGFGNASGEEFFVTFISKPVEPIIWFAIFLGLTAIVVILGVEKGIEKFSKIMMPTLFVMLLIIIVRSVTLPDSVQGLEFMFKPDFSVFKDFKSTVSVASIALAQMFFSLSLGMGAMLTYGSYLGKEQDIESSAMIVPILDTLVAVLAGVAIMPAVYSFKLSPSAGPGLMFITLKEVFAKMPLGNVFGLMFFILVFFAAISSSISLLEVVCAYFIDSKGMDRKKISVLASVGIFILGIPVAMSFGVLSGVKLLLGMDILDSFDYFAEYTLMPLGALLMCLFVGWKWKPDFIVNEVKAGGKPFKTEKYYRFMIQWVTPLLVAFVLYKSSIEAVIKYFLKAE